LKDRAEIDVLEDMRNVLLAPFLGLLLLAGTPAPGATRELVETRRLVSPDHRKVLMAKLWIEPTWIAPQIDLTLTERGKLLFQKTIPQESEARYVKFSWAPDSQAALVAVNFKAAEDWTFLRLTKGAAIATTFDGDHLVTERMFDELPSQARLNSRAPVGRVPWQTVQWLSPRRCAMTYIFCGIGCEGTARLVIDARHKEPALTVLSMTPAIHEQLWKQE
jgi:hypothetical protein